MAKKKRMEPEMYIFDSYQYVKDFQSAGFNEKQAELIVRSLLKSRDTDLSHLATKEQFVALKEQMATKDQLETAVARLEASMIKWMVGFMITFSGIIIAAFKIIK